MFEYRCRGDQKRRASRCPLQQSAPIDGTFENRLERYFTVEAPNQVWAGDISYVWTQEGWLCLAVVIDLYSRKVVG